MDFITMVVLFLAGLSVREVWQVIVRWHSAGVSEEAILEDEYRRKYHDMKELVAMANTETHVWKSKAQAYYSEAEKLQRMNHDLRTVIRETDSALQLVRKAQ